MSYQYQLGLLVYFIISHKIPSQVTFSNIEVSKASRSLRILSLVEIQAILANSQCTSRVGEIDIGIVMSL